MLFNLMQRLGLKLFICVAILGSNFYTVYANEKAVENHKFAFLFHIAPIKSSSPTEKAKLELAPNAKSAILLDADSGEILFAKNQDAALPQASITKLMTLFLVMEHISKGKIKYSDYVQASSYASSMGGSQIFLSPGEKMTVEELMRAAAIASANDASVALAEYIAGTESQFVDMMNERAKNLGLKNTFFKNCTGLPADGHFSSAYDIAMLSRFILRMYPDILKFTSLSESYLRKNQTKPFWLVNTNRLIKFYKGVDGLKTGFTGNAGFCISSTAKRDNLRVIAVVMGEPSSKVRNADIAAMFDYTFANYKRHIIYKAGTTIARSKIKGGVIEDLVIKAPYDIGILLKKTGLNFNIKTKLNMNPLIAPLKKGTKIGDFVIKVNGSDRLYLPLILNQSIDDTSTFEGIRRWFRDLFTENDDGSIANIVPEKAI